MLRISNAGNLIEILRDRSLGTHWHRIVFDTRGMGDRRARKHAAMKRRDEITEAVGGPKRPTLVTYYRTEGIIRTFNFSITLSMDGDA